MLVTGGMLLFVPGLYSDLVGLIPSLVVMALAWKKKASQKEKPLPSSGS
jgi:UPF0716 family protein affecting phage T7 exclusion